MHLYQFCSLYLLFIGGIEVAGPAEQCEVDRRVSCYHEIEQMCLSAGCCWNPVDDAINPNLPWCFKTVECNNNQKTISK